MFFPDFTLEHITVAGGSIRLRRGGSGPPLLLLHGNPQTHAMWHAVAPALTERFTVICPDLRGYGGSFKPEATATHAPYAKKEMARDMVEVMERLGYRRFGVGSHDRGARVAHRLAIDFPDSVEKLAVLDIVPTIEHFERADLAKLLLRPGDRRRHRQRPLPGRGGTAGGGRAIPRVLLVTSSSPTAERLSFVCNACQLDTGTVVPNTPSWATLWGFSGCIRWL